MESSAEVSSVVGRPPKFFPDTVVYITGQTASTKLRDRSERKALVLWLIEQGGRATIQEMEDHFGYDMTRTVWDLEQSAWIAHDRKTPLPRRNKN